ncbi:hypothetical protein B4U80_09799, partial [Leptotrombidium deliense]
MRVNCFSSHHYLRHFSVASQRWHSNREKELFLKCGNQKNAIRNYSQQNSSKTPLLMNFKPIMTPSFWYFIQNFINSVIIIKPYFDPEFTISRFLVGAKQALVVISDNLAQGNIDALKGLVTEEARNEIGRNLTLFTPFQREKLRVKMEDIATFFAYRVGIIMNDGLECNPYFLVSQCLSVAGKRFVEITVVYWCNPLFAELEKKMLMSEKPPNFNDFVNEKMQEEVTVCNYRFIREYTKGVESDWIVNQLNHFKYNDVFE